MGWCSALSPGNGFLLSVLLGNVSALPCRSRRPLCRRLPDPRETSSSYVSRVSQHPAAVGVHCSGTRSAAVSPQQVATLGATPSSSSLFPQGPVQDRVVNKDGGQRRPCSSPRDLDTCLLMWRKELCGCVALKTLRWGDDLGVFGPP